MMGGLTGGHQQAGCGGRMVMGNSNGESKHDRGPSPDVQIQKEKKRRGHSLVTPNITITFYSTRHNTSQDN
jgi:hypothetical protein